MEFENIEQTVFTNMLKSTTSLNLSQTQKDNNSIKIDLKDDSNQYRQSYNFKSSNKLCKQHYFADDYTIRTTFIEENKIRDSINEKIRNSMIDTDEQSNLLSHAIFKNKNSDDFFETESCPITYIELEEEATEDRNNLLYLDAKRREILKQLREKLIEKKEKPIHDIKQYTKKQHESHKKKNSNSIRNTKYSNNYNPNTHNFKNRSFFQSNPNSTGRNSLPNMNTNTDFSDLNQNKRNTNLSLTIKPSYTNDDYIFSSPKQFKQITKYLNTYYNIHNINIKETPPSVEIKNLISNVSDTKSTISNINNQDLSFQNTKQIVPLTDILQIKQTSKSIKDNPNNDISSNNITADNINQNNNKNLSSCWNCFKTIRKEQTI